ncbi:MAG: tetratricopeptide repeat protein [Spirochaetales bacterium]|nr:tetratricopeptide repeat protein [Spirochaetales bacterium]
MKKTATALVLAILISACATAPPAEEPPESSDTSPQAETRFSDEILREIGICSPRSLKRALDGLGVNEVGTSEEGLELRHLTVALFQILYPELSSGLPSVPMPPGSLYAPLLETVRKGQFPQVRQEDVSFLTLIIPPLSSLFTSDPVVLEQCEENLLQAESLDTRSVLPPYLLGIIREKQKLWDKAQEYYTKALERDSSCYPADLGWARAAFQTGEPAEAEKRLETWSEELAENAEYLYLRSQACFLQGRYTEALDFITEALRIRIEHPPYLLLRVKILEAQGNVEQARRILLIVEKKMPENEDIVYLKGRILFKQEQYDEAAIFLEGALKKYGTSDRLSGLYGEVLIAAGKYEEARRYLEAKLENTPEHVPSLRILIRDSLDRGNLEKAEEYTVRLLRLDESNDTLRTAAELYRLLENWEKTLEYSEILHNRQPEDRRIRILYIESLLETGQRVMAEEECLKALAEETDSTTRSTLFYILSRILTDTPRRLDALRSALLENLHNLDALSALADLYVELEDYRKAFRYINQAYMLNPNDPDIRSSYRKIEELAR